MRPTAVLVNTARGAIVDERAVVGRFATVRSPELHSMCSSMNRT